MFLLNCFRAQNHLIHDTWTLPGDAGLKLSFSRFEGYSPLLDGWIRTEVVDSPEFAKSGSIAVTVNVRAPSPNYKDNIRIHQKDNNISISTGGLSLLSSATAPRLTVEITISLPSSIGNLVIKSLSLPIFLQTVERANDIVIHTESASISVANVKAHSLTVSSQSGSITFENESKQQTDKFTTITNSSGSTSLRSSLSSPYVAVESSSGSVALKTVTTATDLKVKNSSGSIGGEIEYVSDNTSVSRFENSSGSQNVRLRGWTGFLTAQSSSGSKNIFGQGLERWNDGWKKGSGDSTVAVTSQSGSIKIEVL